jgi:hypothetical protein
VLVFPAPVTVELGAKEGLVFPDGAGNTNTSLAPSSTVTGAGNTYTSLAPSSTVTGAGNTNTSLAPSSTSISCSSNSRTWC